MNKSGNLDTREGMDTLPIIESMVPWTEKLYDMTPEQIVEYKSAFHEEYHSGDARKAREVVDIFYIEYQYYQIRKDYQWVLDQYKLTGDKMTLRREILLQRLRGSTSSPIDPEDIEYLISKMVKSDNDLIINNKWRFRLYDHGQKSVYGNKLDFDENIPYIVGVDPASGTGNDLVGITIVNPYNLKIAAEFKNKYIGGVELSKLLVSLVINYIPKAVITIERNSMGIYLIQMLCEQTTIKENVYWSKNDRQLEAMVEESEEDFKLRQIAEQYKKFGTYITKKSRDAMFEILFKHVNECKDILLTEYLVDDICKLTKFPTGKIAAAKGAHDDSLMSYLHAVYIYYTGDNLDIFGIVKKENFILGENEVLDIDDNDNDGFFSTENITFESLLMEDTIRLEESRKYLVEHDPNIYDEIYSNSRNNNENPYDDTVSIGAHFFDMINE